MKSENKYTFLEPPKRITVGDLKKTLGACHILDCESKKILDALKVILKCDVEKHFGNHPGDLYKKAYLQGMTKYKDFIWGFLVNLHFPHSRRAHIAHLNEYFPTIKAELEEIFKD